LGVESKIDTIAEEESYVEAPNVFMKITDRNGDNLVSARVGDQLQLIFGISDPNTPYDLFVRKLTALDGNAGDEITLIDDKGCPTDPDILGPIERDDNTKTHRTYFEAFKFPESEVVFFRAVLSFCVNGKCKPVTCEVSIILTYSKKNQNQYN
jgi:hypothetical protein